MNGLNVLLPVLAVSAVGTCFASGLKSPETSRFFVRHEDPVSHVVSWIMKPGLTAHNQQSIYFTAKSMTDDGRFLLYHGSDDEFAGKSVKKRTMLIDFKSDELLELSDLPPLVPFIDPATDQIWYLKGDGVYRRDLAVDPRKEIRLCTFDSGIVLPRGGRGHYATHLTLTPDRRFAFLDWCYSPEPNFQSPLAVSQQLVIDLTTGMSEKWGEADFWINHGQYHPTDSTLALCAYEGCSKKWIREADGRRHLEPRPKDEVYPRLILVERGTRTFVQPLIVNYATHEHWSEDGLGFYWCASGVHWRDLKTGRQVNVCPLGSAHATISADNRYVTSDVSWGGWWRGCGWTTSFWNRDTHQGVFIHSKRPVYATRENPSGLHPDPHPQFVCNDRYVVCTMNVKEHQMTLSVTPVAGLLAATSRPTVPSARLPLEWNPRQDVSTPCEVTVEWRKLEAAGLLPALEPGRAVWLFYGSLGVEATLSDGTVRRLAVTPLAGQTRDFVTLRFRVPQETVKLEMLTSVPGRFEMEDTEHCDNLFLGALDAKAVPRWRVSNGGKVENARFGVLLTTEKAGSTARAEFAVDVPKACAGKPCRFEADVRSLSDRTRSGLIVVRQLDAAGRELPETLVDLSQTDPMRQPRKTVSYREEGFVHKDAARLVFSAELRNLRNTVENCDRPLDCPDRQQPKLLVTRLAVRPARVIQVEAWQGN